jgi:hypothetical protein
VHEHNDVVATLDRRKPRRQIAREERDLFQGRERLGAEDLL